jgi:hypothetical protein
MHICSIINMNLLFFLAIFFWLIEFFENCHSCSLKTHVMLKMQYITGMGITLMVVVYGLVTLRLFTFTSTSVYLLLFIYLFLIFVADILFCFCICP